MNRTLPAESHDRRATPDAGIAWENLPSLADRLVRRAERPAPGPTEPAWQETQPLSLDALAAAAVISPFRQPFEGLDVREVDEQEIFRHYFGH